VELHSQTLTVLLLASSAVVKKQSEGDIVWVRNDDVTEGERVFAETVTTARTKLLATVHRQMKTKFRRMVRFVKA